MFDVIERLKADWTDKYVVINCSAPELARFAQATGQVKTVNMNGRCLVEFDQFNNTGWYDIDPTALKIVPKPEPKPAAEKQEKPAKAAPAAKAPPAPGAKKPSTADILAAARAKGGAAPAAAKAAPAAAKPAGARPSTADMLAAARGGKPKPPVAPAPAEPEAAPEPEAAAPEPTVTPNKAKPAAGGALPTTTADKIAWCRANDAHE